MSLPGGGNGTGGGGGGSKNPLTNPLNLLTLGIGGLGGAFPQTGTTSGTATSNSGTQTTASSNNTSSSDVNSLLSTLSDLITKNNQTTGTTPTLSPQANTFMNGLIGKFTNLTNNGPNLAPYQAQQTQQINANSGLQSQAVNNILAARGLATSPVAGTANANIQAGRVGQITNLAESIPLLQQQLQRENLGAAGGFFSQLPRGSVSQTSGGTEQIGNTQQSGVTSGVNKSDTNAQTNSASQGTTVQNAKTSQGGGLGGVFGAIAPILAALIP